MGYAKYTLAFLFGMDFGTGFGSVSLSKRFKLVFSRGFLNRLTRLVGEDESITANATESLPLFRPEECMSHSASPMAEETIA